MTPAPLVRLRPSRAEDVERRASPGGAEQRYLARLRQAAEGPIAVKVINHLGDEVMKVFRVQVDCVVWFDESYQVYSVLVNYVNSL
jgi:hypothetical protein